jgi:NADH dehydrogenase (ubiquinone) 1 alpha subcomplex subunit 5
MRRTLRQLAAVKPSRFLEPGAPTGLTGLLTHSAPRSTLIYLYSSTLEKLAAFPETSLYRQSTEAITKHRMAIVSAVEPDGYKLWAERAKLKMEEHPDVFTTAEGDVPHDDNRHVRVERDGKAFVVTKAEKLYDDQTVEWDGEEYSGGELEGTRSEKERRGQATIAMKRPGSDKKTVKWDPEPPLSIEQ